MSKPEIQVTPLSYEEADKKHGVKSWGTYQSIDLTPWHREYSLRHC